MRNGLNLPEHLELENFQNSFLSRLMVAEKGKSSGLMSYINSQIDPTISWKDIAWLKGITKLPLVVKGESYSQGLQRRC